MDALFAFDRQLYSAIVTAVANNLLLAGLAIVIAYLNWNGFIWGVAGLFVARARGWGRRGLWAALTVYVGLVDGWLMSELLKLVFRRPRPFTVVLDLPRPLIDEPTSFSFPSGDATFAFGAAVALGHVAPAWRIPALLFALAVAFERVAVGVHYPIDVTAGAIIGTISGLTAPYAVALIRRRVRWRAFVVPHTHWDREWYERFEGYRARLVPMVSKLLDLLDLLGKKLESTAGFQIICGYRSPVTNAMLHEKTSGVASNSLHMVGQAIDIRVADRGLDKLHDTALAMKVGGVGYYPSSNFVHVDVGAVRHWLG